MKMRTRRSDTLPGPEFAHVIFYRNFERDIDGNNFLSLFITTQIPYQYIRINYHNFLPYKLPNRYTL